MAYRDAQTAYRTLLDVAAERRFPQEQLDRAVGDALRAGLVTGSSLRRALGQVATEAARERLDAALSSAKAY